MDVWVWVWTLWVGWGEGGQDSLQEKQREKCAFVGVVGGVWLLGGDVPVAALL